MSEAIIRTTDLAKSYLSGDVTTHALRGVDLEIQKGSFTCIIGPSGHGKSTLMHLVGGLDRPTQGSVVLDGTDIATRRTAVNVTSDADGLIDVELLRTDEITVVSGSTPRWHAKCAAAGIDKSFDLESATASLDAVLQA